MSSALSVFLLMASISNGAELDTCRYIETSASLPIIAMDVCRTYSTAGNVEYKKYVCDALGALQDEVWDSNTCNGNLISTSTPSGEGSPSYNCANLGDCEYLMLARYPYSDDCTGDYSIQPVISGTCHVSGKFASNSWFLNCTDKSLNYKAGDSTCPSDVGTVTSVETCSGSLNHIDLHLGVWEAMSGCLTVSYATESPTQWTHVPSASPTEQPSEPTGMPSESPTKVPTEISEMPSTTPTKAPTEMPSETPTKIPTDAPSDVPTKTPSDVPTNVPTVSTDAPSGVPSDAPTKTPSDVPTNVPSDVPSDAPSDVLSNEPGSGSHFGLIINAIIGVLIFLAT
eukprot:273425_1